MAENNFLVARSQTPALAVIHKFRRAKNAVIPAGIAGIQKPWRANSSMSKCLILVIFSPQFHIPVDWIPAIPAGMTGFQHKSVRIEIFRGIGLYTIVTGKRSLTPRRKGAKKSDFLCAFASWRETCLLNCRTFMCSDKYRHTCV